jgi:hypothetical protein
MAITFAYNAHQGVAVYDAGKLIYLAKTRNDYIALLGVLYFSSLANQLATINGARLEHPRHQARLIQLVGEAMCDLEVE